MGNQRRAGKQSGWRRRVAGGRSDLNLPRLGRRLWQSARTGPQGTFVGDRRTIVGGVAGLGATLAAAYGFGDIGAKRLTAAGFANSLYRGHVDAVLGEVSYYWGLGQTRIVPKAAVEYVRARTDAFSEFGGLDPVTAGSANLERTRFLVGAEIGHFWIVDTRVIDLSGYAKFVDNVSQNVDSVLVSLAPTVLQSRTCGKADTARMPALRLRSA